MALIIFDLDETLIHHKEDTYYMLFNGALEYFGIKKIGYEEYRNMDLWNHESIEAIHNLISGFFGLDGKKFFGYLNSVEGQFHKKMLEKGAICVFEDVSETIEKLKQLGHKIGVVTNSGRESALIKLNVIGHDFDIVITRDDVEKAKPHADPLLKAINSLGFSKEDVVFVGDSEIDRIASERAGIKFIMLNRGGGGDINSLKELHGFVKSYFS